MSVKRNVTVPPGSSYMAGMLGGSFAEPARAPARGELSLFRREILRRPHDRRRRRGAAEEVRLHLRDTPATELEVAVALALVAPRHGLAVEPRDDVVGGDARGVLREHACLRHREGYAVAHRV